MESIEDVQKQIKQEFEALADKDAKWIYLLKRAREHQGMNPALKDEKFLVKGCATRLYLVPRMDDDNLVLEMDTDEGSSSPLIVRGLASLAQRLYSGRKPAEILATSPAFFQEIGLHIALSPTRANGFASLLKQIYLYAKVFQSMGVPSRNS